MSDRFTDQLSPYLDGELAAAARARLEAHLAECAECARVLADLRLIVAAAPGYQGTEPARNLWPGIQSRLGADLVDLDETRLRRRGLRRFGWAELIAASVVMAAVSGGGVWYAVSSRSSVPAPAAPASRRPSDVPIAPWSPDAASFSEDRVDAAAADLEKFLAANRDRLDSTTVRVVEENLRRIDAAIAEARAAIQRDPANSYLSRQIDRNLRRKLDLLRIAANAIATAS